MNGGPPPPNENTGTSKDAVAVRQLIRYVKSCELKSVVGGTVSRGPDGTKIVIDQTFGGGSPGASMEKFSFLKSFGDYIHATRSTDGVRTLIAKPPELRNSISGAWYDGTDSNLNHVNYTYPKNPPNWDTVPTYPTLDANAFVRRQGAIIGNTIQEGVVPRYLAANLALTPIQAASTIYAMKVTPDTGVVSVLADSNFPNGTSIIWLEVSARAWATLYNQNG